MNNQHRCQASRTPPNLHGRCDGNGACYCSSGNQKLITFRDRMRLYILKNLQQEQQQQQQSQQEEEGIPGEESQEYEQKYDSWLKEDEEQNPNTSDVISPASPSSRPMLLGADSGSRSGSRAPGRPRPTHFRKPAPISSSNTPRRRFSLLFRMNFFRHSPVASSTLSVHSTATPSAVFRSTIISGQSSHAPNKQQQSSSYTSGLFMRRSALLTSRLLSSRNSLRSTRPSPTRQQSLSGSAIAGRSRCVSIAV